jgi:hypothetical protein
MKTKNTQLLTFSAIHLEDFASPPPQGVREPQVGSTSLKYVTALCCCWQEVCPLFGSPCSVTKHGWQLTSATGTCSYVTRVRNRSCITIGLLPWTRSDRPACVPARVANYFGENSGTRWPEPEGVRYTKITATNKVYAVYNRALLLKSLLLQDVFTYVVETH